MYYIYVIESKKTGRFYIGQTENLDDRVTRHNKGRVTSTKNKGPWELKYSREVKSRSEAVLLEKKLKGFKKREALVRFFEDDNIRGVAQSG